MNRRELITGLAALVAAPSIVRAGSLMPIQGERYFFWDYSCPMLPDIGWRWEDAYKKGISVSEYVKPWLGPNGQIYRGTWTFYGKTKNIYGDEQVAFRKEEYPVAWAARPQHVGLYV